MKHIFSHKNFFIFCAVGCLLITWEIVARSMDSALLLPTPTDVLKKTVEILLIPESYRALLSTILRGMTGFVLALFLALFTGIAAGLVPVFYYFLSPLITVLRSVPVIAFILLALIWIGPENVPLLIGFIMMYPILVVNIIEGIRNFDTNLADMSRVYKISLKTRILNLYIPGIRPFLLSGICTAIGFGWKAVIIGEVLAQPRIGIGSIMHTSQTYLLVTDLMAWTIIAVLIGYFFEQIIRIITTKINP